MAVNSKHYLNSTIPSNVPTVVETPREAAITQPQRNLTANTPTQLSSENAGAPKIAANPANQTPRVQKDQGGGNPKLAREGNKKQAANQNAITYKNGIPIANPYGFVAGSNRTRTITPGILK